MLNTNNNHPYIPNTSQQANEMLKTIGVTSFNDLLSDIPEQCLYPDISLANPLSESELFNNLVTLSKENIGPEDYSYFLGAGAYRHYIPSTVKTIASRGEFLTAYTPYQPEAAQGTLQVGFEFQSMICQLTGMDLTNAGMYDGPTAFAEACLMASRITQKNTIGLLPSTDPRIVAVLQSYIKNKNLKILTIRSEKDYKKKDLACIGVQYPDFFGNISDVKNISDICKSINALSVVHVNPISLGLLKPPGELGADIVTAEGQPLGIPMSFGGPYVGLFSCSKKYMRQMPGRIIGKTTDTNGNVAYTLTLQTREQHIRRERATSNICTSTQLMALMVSVYLATLGPEGMKRTATLCYQKAHYAADRINNLKGFKVEKQLNFFNEFIVKCPIDPDQINDSLLTNKIIGGLNLHPVVDKGMLVCCTELNTKESIDSFVSSLEKATIG